MTIADLFKPYLGRWTSRPGGPGTASGMTCRRVLTALGPHVKLEADWRDGYQEVAVFALDEAGRPEFWSFTSDGGRPHGTLGDGADVHPQAVAFIAPMPQGKARMLYWPAEGGGFNFAVEAQTPAGWSRFMHHLYEAEA